ncbi:MAG: hypothetical protein HY927_06935 [Elusimicrobia bacterium]|nr:hypothetical protein [Elusimicrobiota bacterium]
MKRKYRLVLSGRHDPLDAPTVAARAAGYPGCYLLIVEPRPGASEVVFVGVAMESIGAALSDHLAGIARPTMDELRPLGGVYYDYVSSSDIDAVQDHLDIAGALVALHKPRFNAGPPPSTGRFSEVTLEEV